MRDIMISTGYYDAQWRKYESGGSLNVASLLKVALALNVSLSVLLDGLGQWPQLSVAEIQAQHRISPDSIDESEPDSKPEPAIPVKSSPGKKASSSSRSSEARSAPNVVKAPARTTQDDSVRRKRTTAK